MDIIQSDSEAIEIAISRFIQERYDESNDILLDLVRNDINTSFISFCIGRNFLYSKDVISAAEWFERSLSLPNPFRWTYYELARLKNLESQIIDAAQLAEHFVRSYSEDRTTPEFNEIHKSSLLGIAHRCFGTDRGRAVQLYAELGRIGVKDYLSALRIIEKDLDDRKIQAAHEKMTVLMADHSLDAWGEFALSRIQFAQGNVTVAINTAIAAPERQPDNNILRTTAVHRLLEFKALPEARVQYNKTLAPLLGQRPELDKEIRGIDFRISVLLRDHEQILASCQIPGFLAGIPNWLSVEALFKFALPGEQIDQLDIKVATQLAQFLESQFPYSLGTILSLYQFYSRRRMWSKISELEQSICDDPHYNHHEVVMRRFETLCAMSRMEEARAFYQKHYADTTLRQWEACVVLRFLAEAKMWDEAGALLKQFIGSRYFFPDGDYFLLKICRRANLHRQIIAIIRANRTGDVPEQFDRLEKLLTDDLLLKEAEDPKYANKGIRNTLISSGNRMLYKAPPPKSTPRIVGYLCADKAYYMSLLTFLASFVSNSVGNEGITWFVFLAEDVPKTWFIILRDFARKIGLSLEVVKEVDFVNSGARYTENYGIFTGGNTLSRAAFLRIYAAKYLYGIGQFDRACYIDSDIVCLKDVSSFIAKPFHGALLLARAEELSPEVESVTQQHGIREMSYFNSGVLVFNFRSRKVIDRIEEALRIAETEPERLVFHDQCALNIAFADKVTYLEPRFNYFLRPHRPDNGDFSDATFLHFLDKPKPWDLSYSREYRRVWTRYAEMVRVLLSSKNYSAIVAAANQ
jgi:lipopolysaccharide biosynthesis glycosyltransferase